MSGLFDDSDTEDGGVEEPAFTESGTGDKAKSDAEADEKPGLKATFTDALDRPEPDYSRIGTAAAAAVSLIPKPLYGIRASLYRRLAFKSLENYHDIADGDALALDAKAGNQLDLTPVKYRTIEECEPGEKPGWKAKDEDKVWNAGSEGRVVDYLGDVPVVALDRDSHVEAGWLRPRIAEAIELDRYGPIHTNSHINLITEVNAGPGGAAANGAVADGGQMVDIELEQLGEWAGDAIVDLDSGDGYDGMRVSFSKASEWMSETATTEEMQQQHERGVLKGQLGSDGPNTTKLFIYACLFALAVIGLVLLGPQLIGGDGGSGINPLMIDMAATLL